ncbi:glycoside hydrolase family 17 [Rhodanobacter thiooxydans]|uniref:Endo-1,3-beta-glucanase btgC n=2 Tax=Rhodanobacter thiooxydans TaxID=416169 RepID=A0A154QGH9_9GAMM|nr:glycoside hydrolase family 17 [Rhodanobacter thiooxydans]KZC23341.1 glycoside hydrolase family 17 [Rhodanobacter thiooxydans]MCW0201221.1 glycoside hydrolase family 17 [Rhodanobacter thiooxydans]
MSPAASPVFRRAWPAWLVLVLATLAGASWWWSVGRPVALPDAPSTRIACVSYAPFRQAGETPLDASAFISPERIDAGLRALSQRFDCVRTYSQGQGLSAVPAIAERYGMKVLLGIWLSGDARANAQQVALGIATANKYPQVLRGVIVGNEVLLRGELTSAQLAGYLHQVRTAVSVPVTYADVWEFWLRHPELAGSVDYLTIHILPYWEDQPVPPERAVQHVATVYAKVQQAFPGRRVMIGETGWPSAGRPRQAASASVVNEARYLREFLRYAATVHMPYNVIEAFDQPWKRAQEGTAGGYWGIFDAQARPKFAMQGPVTEEPRWWAGWLAGGAGAALFALAGGWRRRWRGGRGWLALALAGAASGSALAWQFRQMLYACRDGWEWALSLAAGALALLTALRLARWIAARLAGTSASAPPPRWLRAGWLFALAYYGLLLAVDGRYRDFPLGLFWLPCLGYALLGWLGERHAMTMPLPEERFLALWPLPLALAVLLQEAGLTPVAWLWLSLNLLLVLPVLLEWCRARRDGQVA